MSVKKFTNEEVEALRCNPYTHKVTQCQLSFTAEFKERFLELYNEGMSPRDILISLGYDPAVLGDNRISGIRMHIKEESGSQEGFNSGRRPRRTSSGSGGSSPADPADEVRQLRNEVEKDIRKAGEILMNEPSAIFEIIHSLAGSPDSHLSVSEMCSIAGVFRSGYYAWVTAAPLREAQEEQNRRDFEAILEAYQWRGYFKGAKGIYMRLLHMEPPVVQAF